MWTRRTTAGSWKPFNSIAPRRVISATRFSAPLRGQKGVRWLRSTKESSRNFPKWLPKRRRKFSRLGGIEAHYQKKGAPENGAPLIYSSPLILFDGRRFSGGLIPQHQAYQAIDHS